MARVRIHLFASLRSYAAGAPSVDVDVEPGQTVEEVLRTLGVPPEQTRILFVNHRAATLDQKLSGDEQIGVFPAIGGG
jgi:molybdopterin converting factor small subunit